MKISFVSTLGFVFLFSSCQHSSPSLSNDPQENVFITIKGVDLNAQQLKNQNKEKELTVYETHLKSNATYVGYSLVEFLDANFKNEWRTYDGILFTALDGYRSDISVAKILKYNPLLAFSFKDSKQAFSFDNKAQNEKDVDLGPFYLVWDNINNPELLREGAHGWPYQVAVVEPIMYGQYYAKAFPIKNPTAQQKQGFELFKIHCISCHSVSGEEGGAKGPVLYPNPAVISKGFKSFRKWTQGPSLVKPGTTMPPLNVNLTKKEKDEVTKLIYSYLIALNKK